MLVENNRISPTYVATSIMSVFFSIYVNTGVRRQWFKPNFLSAESNFLCH